MPESLSQEIIAKRKSLQEFINQHLIVWERQVYEASSLSEQEAKIRVIEKSKHHGFFQMTQPSTSQPSTLLLTTLRETLAEANLHLSRYVFGPSPGILSNATGQLREKYMLPLIRGEIQGAFGFTEPKGLDPKKRTRAVLHVGADGKRELVITGQKSYVTGGGNADFVSILARVFSEKNERIGSSMIVVDTNLPGVSIKKKFYSIDGSSHVYMMFKSVRVPASNVIGTIGEGLPRALRQIGNVRVRLSAQAVGLCLWALKQIKVTLALEHRNGKVLAEKESVQLRVADMIIETMAARAALYRTARQVDLLKQRQRNSGNEDSTELKELVELTQSSVIATKIFTTEVAGRVIDAALQLTGGKGIVRGHPMEQAYRYVRTMRFTEGSSDFLRLKLARSKL